MASRDRRPKREAPADNRMPDDRVADNRIKDPDDWATGEEPMTGAQESYLNTLAAEAGKRVEPDLTKAEASRRIDELQEKTGRGRSA